MRNRRSDGRSAAETRIGGGGRAGAAGAAAYWLLRAQPGTGVLTASGTIELEEITLSAESAGRIAELMVDEGSTVLEGQVIGRLADPVLTVQLKQATIDPAQQQVVQAQMSRLELARRSGVCVQKRIAHKGEFVGLGAPILTIADPTDLKLTLLRAGSRSRPRQRRPDGQPQGGPVS